MAEKTAPPVNAGNYDEEKKSMLDRILALIKSFLTKLHILRSKDDNNKNNAMIFQRLEEQLNRAEEAVEELREASDVNLDALRKLVNITANMEERISKLNPDNLTAELENLNRDIEAQVGEIHKLAGKTFDIQGNLPEVLAKKFGRELSEDEIKELPLLMDKNGKIYAAIPKNPGDKTLEKFAEITIEQVGEDYKVRIGDVHTAKELVGLGLDKDKLGIIPGQANGMNLEERVILAATEVLKSKESEGLQEQYKRREAMMHYKKFIESYRDNQDSKEFMSRYDEEQNLFQVYDKKTKMQMTLQRDDNGNLTAMVGKVDRPFERNPEGEVKVASWENVNGRMIASQRDQLGDAVKSLLTSEPVQSYLAVFEIDQKSIDKRIDEQRRSLGNGFKAGRSKTAEEGQKVYGALLQEAIPSDWDVRPYGKGSLDVIMNGGQTVRISFSNAGVPADIKFASPMIDGDNNVVMDEHGKIVHETASMLIDGTVYDANVHGEGTERNLRTLMATLQTATKRYIENGHKLASQQMQDAQRAAEQARFGEIVSQYGAALDKINSRWMKDTGIDIGVTFEDMKGGEDGIKQERALMLTDRATGFSLVAQIANDGSGRISGVAFGREADRMIVETSVDGAHWDDYGRADYKALIPEGTSISPSQVEMIHQSMLALLANVEAETTQTGLLPNLLEHFQQGRTGESLKDLAKIELWDIHRKIEDANGHPLGDVEGLRDMDKLTAFHEAIQEARAAKRPVQEQQQEAPEPQPVREPERDEILCEIISPTEDGAMRRTHVLSQNKDTGEYVLDGKVISEQEAADYMTANQYFLTDKGRSLMETQKPTAQQEVVEPEVTEPEAEEEAPEAAAPVAEAEAPAPSFMDEMFDSIFEEPAAPEPQPVQPEITEPAPVAEEAPEAAPPEEEPIAEEPETGQESNSFNGYTVAPELREVSPDMQVYEKLLKRDGFTQQDIKAMQKAGTFDYVSSFVGLDGKLNLKGNAGQTNAPYIAIEGKLYPNPFFGKEKDGTVKAQNISSLFEVDMTEVRDSNNQENSMSVAPTEITALDVKRVETEAGVSYEIEPGQKGSISLSSAPEEIAHIQSLNQQGTEVQEAESERLAATLKEDTPENRQMDKILAAFGGRAPDNGWKYLKPDNSLGSDGHLIEADRSAAKEAPFVVIDKQVYPNPLFYSAKSGDNKGLVSANALSQLAIAFDGIESQGIASAIVDVKPAIASVTTRKDKLGREIWEVQKGSLEVATGRTAEENHQKALFNYGKDEPQKRHDEYTKE